MFDFTPKELRIFSRLNTPAKIQDFLNKLPINFEKNGETCMSPRMVLKKNRAHCIEGALLAAVILRIHGFPPLLVDMAATPMDAYDHVITVFQINGRWGAISKTNHAVLRYREPIYTNIRELVMSYFHEYFLDDGRKTLRTYTNPIDISRFDARGWMTDEEDVWYIPEFLANAKHNQLMTRSHIKRLRKADPIEIKAGKLVEWK